MSENVSEVSIEETASGASAQTWKAIVFGGLAVGVLDCLAATINAARSGVSFSRVWQFVASGLLGRESYNYGWSSVALGLLIHFFIAFSVATVYYLASRRFPILIRQAVLFGALYGVAVYFFMGYVVSPLSATAKLPFSFSSMLIGILIHIFFVGLPAALIVRRFAK
jgi:hypothetical protein